MAVRTMTTKRKVVGTLGVPQPPPSQLKTPLLLTGIAGVAGYNALALGSLAINQVVFAVALPLTYVLVASALGILAGMVLTYTVSGAVLFRRAVMQPRPDTGPVVP